MTLSRPTFHRAVPLDLCSGSIMHVIELGSGAISLSIVVVRCGSVDACLMDVCLYRSE